VEEQSILPSSFQGPRQAARPQVRNCAPGNDDDGGCGAPPHSRGVIRPSCALNLTLMKSEGAGNAGCPMHPWSVCKKVHTASPQVHRKSPGAPCAMVLTAYSALSPATNSSCHRRQRIEGFAGPVGPAKTSADLTPATGARTTRLRRTRTGYRQAASVACAHQPKHSRTWIQRRSSARLRIAHGKPALRSLTRPTLPRPPHPAPNVRDDRDTPLSEEAG
jgi:hypothetical protein